MAIVYFCFTLLISGLYASSQGKMNGIALNDFKDFTKKWELISVRYRKDSTEMRFVYANKVAIKALKDEKSVYPDGSVFGKVSFVTREDPNFTSSVVPINPSRIQFMVKDELRFKEASGWGYALFKPTGELMPGDMKEKTLACAACHSLVEEQGHVFSTLMGYGRPAHFSMPPNKKLIFSQVKVNKLPKNLSGLIPTKYKTVNSLQGILKKHLFYGTLDEIRPTLIKKTISTKRPSLLIGNDKKYFSVVFINKLDSLCHKENEHSLTSYHVSAPPKFKIIKTNFCENKK